MTQLSKQLKCICLYGDIELFVEAERADKLVAMMKSPNSERFVEIDGQIISITSVIAVLDAQKVGDRARRRNGEYQCEYGKWHYKGEEGRQEHYWCKKDAEKNGSHQSTP